MLKLNHTIGGTLLVSGTTIGAAMLAVPIASSFMGFWPSFILFVICWAFMLCSAFFFIDVNLSYKGETNIISMADKTLGTFGKIVGWVFYMLLLYSLVAAYIAGSARLFHDAFFYITGMHIPTVIAPFLLPLLFGSFIYFGTFGVDFLNRILMLGLFISYLVLVIFVPPHIQSNLLSHTDFRAFGFAVPIVITSFGYHIIIPSLTTYLKHDRQALRKCVLIGSSITFVIYVFWQILVLGVVPLQGPSGLAHTWAVGGDSSAPLSAILHQPWVKVGAHFFSFFAIVTSFLGVSLSLSDFLIDGLKIKKNWEGKLGACFLTFLPPLGFVFTYQRGFYAALEYAGVFVAILLILLPSLMAWTLKKNKFYQSIKGKFALSIVMLFALCVIFGDVLVRQGYFKAIIEHYTVR